MRIILSDNNKHYDFLPITFSRPIAEIRVGIYTNTERWEKLLNNSVEVYYNTQEYLQEKYPNCSEDCLIIDATIIPNKQIVELILNFKNNEQISYKNQIIAKYNNSNPQKTINVDFDLTQLDNVSDIFSKAGEIIKQDFDLTTNNRTSNKLSSTNTIIGDNLVFIEDGVFAECSIFNTTDGPIYLAKDSQVMEGSKIRGPFVLGEHSHTKMDTKIYGPTCVGPHCKVGGELNNVVILGYTNKAHDGFLGNSVIGEWCNLGADTNCSNLKNNYAEVKIWDYNNKRFKNTGLQFCGLLMADHSKSGINTMFNTGTVVGFSANIFGSGFPRNIINSFSWGGASGFTEYKINKALEVAKIVMARRGLELNDIDLKIFKYLYENKA